MQDYHHLIVWQKAHVLATSIHLLSASIPRVGNADAIGQMRRAALSIPSNIAEGCGRSTDRDFAKFLMISFGSASELESQLEYAAATALISSEDLEARRAEIVQIRRMLTGLIRRVQPKTMSEIDSRET